MNPENIQAHILYGAPINTNITVLMTSSSLIIDSHITTRIIIDMILEFGIDISISPESYKICSYNKDNETHKIILFYDDEGVCISRFQYIKFPVSTDNINIIKFNNRYTRDYIINVIMNEELKVNLNVFRLSYYIYMYMTKSDQTSISNNTLGALYLFSISKKSVNMSDIMSYIEIKNMMFNGSIINYDMIKYEPRLEFNSNIHIIDMDKLHKLMFGRTYSNLNFDV